MVKKLIKYDFIEMLRLIAPIQLILLGVSVLTWLLSFLKDLNNPFVNIFTTLSTLAWGLGILASLIISVLLPIIRFYRSMYKNEGYLSHTLPVTPLQHIISKLAVAFLFSLGTFVTVILSILIALPLNLKAFFRDLGEFNNDLNRFGFNAAWLWTQIILVSLLFITTFILKWYFCVSVGQMAKKRKILLSFGAYFAIYFIRQILSSLFLVIYSSFTKDDIFRIYGGFADFIHWTIGFSIIIYTCACIIYICVTRYIMKHKLNL